MKGGANEHGVAELGKAITWAHVNETKGFILIEAVDLVGRHTGRDDLVFLRGRRYTRFPFSAFWPTD